MFDAERVGVMLMEIEPGLPRTDNFQHWAPWRPIVVETARHDIDVRHLVLHAEREALVARIEGEHNPPSPFRLSYLDPYAEAARTWLHAEGEVVDTTDLTALQVAQRVADSVLG